MYIFGLKQAQNQTKALGAFHSTKNSRNFEMGTKWNGIPWVSFQKIRKLLNFRKASHLTETPNAREIPVEKFPKIYVGYNPRGCLLF